MDLLHHQDDHVVEAGESVMMRFHVGDNVSHISAGDGIVVAASLDGVHVQFRGYIGKYDARWFELHPHYLFHRGTAPVETSR